LEELLQELIAELATVREENARILQAPEGATLPARRLPGVLVPAQLAGRIGLGYMFATLRT
jgi:hypothetical protein